MKVSRITALGVDKEFAGISKRELKVSTRLTPQRDKVEQGISKRELKGNPDRAPGNPEAVQGISKRELKDQVFAYVYVIVVAIESQKEN